MLIKTNDVKTLLSTKKRDDFKTNFVIPGILTENGMLTIFGQSKIGKTYFAIQLGFALACGKDFLRFNINRKYNVLYINGEIEEDDFAQRMFDIKRIYDVNDEDDYNFKFEFVENDDEFEKVEDSLDDLDYFKNYCDGLIEKYKDEKIEIVIIDPIYSFISDENSSKEFRKFLKIVKNLKKELHCAVILIHHRGKKTDSYDITNRGSGSSVIGRKSTAIFDLHSDDKNKIIRIEYTGTRVKTPNSSFSIKKKEDCGFYEVVQK